MTRRREFLKAVAGAGIAGYLAGPGSFSSLREAAGAESNPTESGEVLYNGIALPKLWPPRRDTLPRDPVDPPYLNQPPKVISIDLGRQLLVDDFLIEQTTLK